MNKRKIIIYILPMIFLICSCEYEASIEYQIENKTKGAIRVDFESSSGSRKSDTLIIEINKKETLVIQSKGLRSVDSYKEDLEYLKEFSKMDIYLYDSIKSETNFLKSENWEYIEHNAHQATEKCVVTETDFK